MSDDWRVKAEKDRIAREQVLKKERAEFAILSANLENVLDYHVSSLDTLQRQSAVLDQLFTAIMQHNLKCDRFDRTFNVDRLNKALRVQKQCMDTTKTAAVVEYMNNLAPRPLRTLPSPTPALRDDRNE